MATNDDRADETPEDPGDLLPEESVLSLSDYLDMQAAVGHPTRFEVVYRLARGGEASPTALDDVIDVDDSTLHYHLDELVDVGLIEKRRRTERASDGLYTYYRVTPMGEALLDHGVEELLRREWAFADVYRSDDDA
jgi:DNA-binding transcriptional ArsR family regulator